MRLRLKFESLKETTASEYLQRFLVGGLITVGAGLVADRYGPVVGGLFLAFPGIFPAGITLVEKHKTQREQREGKVGTSSARGEASVEAAGASAGTIGLMGFAVVLWRGLPSHGFLPSLVAALAAWLILSWLAWWARERL